jgi:ureidoglycolate lyase
MTDNALTIELLTQAGFAPFGDVIESGERDSFFINNDMAERFHALARVEALGEDAGAIISLVKSKKYEMPRKLDHAEHHPLGSQAFVPLDDTPFIVVVASPCDLPRPEDFHAFVTDGKQGINYHPGTWHHVLLTPYSAMTFLCVDRVGAGNNCIDHFFDLDQQWLLEMPPG